MYRHPANSVPAKRNFLMTNEETEKGKRTIESTVSKMLAEIDLEIDSIDWRENATGMIHDMSITASNGKTIKILAIPRSVIDNYPGNPAQLDYRIQTLHSQFRD